MQSNYSREWAEGIRFFGIGTLEGTVCKVNLIITDCCMPGMIGYELLKKIKESSVLKEVPVVIMSSENIPTCISQYISAFDSMISTISSYSKSWVQISFT